MKTIFERIVPNWLPYWVFWIFISMLLYTITETLVYFFKDNQYSLTALAFCLGLGVIPSVIIFYSKYFDKIFSDLGKVIKINDDVLGKWLSNWEYRIFTHKTLLSKLFSLAIGITATLTIILLGSPFNNLVLTIMVYSAFFVLACSCGKILHMSIELLYFLSKLSKKEFNNIPFLRVPNPILQRFQKYFSSLSFLFLILYFGLFISTWQGPYGFHIIMIIWLSLIVVVPIVMYVFIFHYFSKINSGLIEKFADEINLKISQVKNKIINTDNLDKIEQINILYDIQQKIIKTKINRLTADKVFVFFSTFGVALIQIVLSYMKLK